MSYHFKIITNQLHSVILTCLFCFAFKYIDCLLTHRAESKWTSLIVLLTGQQFKVLHKASYSATLTYS